MPQRLTTEQLQEIEARANAATPGPWVSFRSRLTGNVDGDRFGYVIERHDEATKEKPWAQYALSYARGDFSGIIGKADAEFMAAARQDIPALLAEIKALRIAMGLAAKAVTQDDAAEAYHQLYIGLVGDLSLPADEQSRIMRDAMEAACPTK